MCKLLLVFHWNYVCNVRYLASKNGARRVPMPVCQVYSCVGEEHSQSRNCLMTVDRNGAVVYGKTRMVGLLDGEKSLRIC